MVMQSYSTSTVGKSYTLDGYTGELSESYQNIGYKSLGDIISAIGDYHSPTPHSYVKSDQRGYFGKVETFYGPQLVSRTYGAHAYPYYADNYLAQEFDNNAYNQALNKAYEMLRSGENSVDVSIDLVQWRTMLKMVSLHRRLISSIAKSAKHLIPHVVKAETLKSGLAREGTRGRRWKRRARELNRTLNYIAEKRVEYVYGWAPTMATIQELAERALHPTAPGWIEVSETGKGTVQKTVLDSSINAKVKVKHIVTTSNRARVVMYFTPQQTVLDNLGRVSSLNPVSILYEATPFSFVLDWAWDISGFFRTFETALLHRNDFVTGYVTKTMRSMLNSSMVGTEKFTGGFHSYDLTGVAMKTKFSRYILSSAPFPTRPVKQLDFGAQRQLNAIALAKIVLLRADDLLANRR